MSDMHREMHVAGIRVNDISAFLNTALSASVNLVARPTSAGETDEIFPGNK